MIIAAGCGSLIIGYALLTKTDPAGQNLPSLLSPLFIIGGYISIGIGIIFPSSSTNISAPPLK
jgi:hypothetical protein